MFVQRILVAVFAVVFIFLGAYAYGYHVGSDAVADRAIVADLMRQLAEKAQDAEILAAASADAAERQKALVDAAQAAEGQLNEYRSELESLARAAAEKPEPGPVGADDSRVCDPLGRGALHLDVDRLRKVERLGRKAKPARASAR